MKAATYEIPEGNYTDKFGISGVYYFSEISGEWSEDNYINGVNIEFDYDNRHMKIHYGPDKTDHAYMRSEMKELVDKEIMKTPIMFEGSNMNLIEFLRLETISLIEEGLFFVHYSSTPYVNTDCNKPKWQPKAHEGKENHYVLLGKDKDRIKELMNDPEKVQELALAALIKECEYWNIYREAKNPMPARGMSDSKLQADISDAAIRGAAGRGWKEEILYAYSQSKEWYTLRNKVTGIITGRELAAIVVMKTDSGICKWEQVILRQNYNGSSYGGTYWHGNSQRIYPVDCKEALKYK